ncbi:MAG: diguanylate cyclase [Legionella sp.]|nr:diguanylate cyclase [Legionella sp.]
MNKARFKAWIITITFSIVAVSFAALLRLWPLNILENNLMFITFYPAVMIASVYAGFFGGLIATLVSTLYVYLLFLEKIAQLDYTTSLIGIILFNINGIIFSVVGELLRRTQSRMNDLLQKANLLGDALNRISSYIYIKDLKHRYIYANQQTLELFKCTSETLTGRTDADFFPPETTNQINKMDNKILKSGKPATYELVVNHPDGKKTIYLDIKTPIYENDNSNKICGICGISTDITERKNQEDALRESQEKFISIFNSASTGMALLNIDGYFIEINNALCDILGYTKEELMKLTFKEITHPEDLSADLMLIKELMDRQRLNYQIEKRYFHKDGRIIWILLSGSVVHDNEMKIKYFIVQIMDITEQKQFHDRLEHLAYQDYLTALKNRRYFFEQGENEYARALRFNQPLSLIMLDIDHFKKVNDTYGHKTGDLLLISLSKILTRILRKIDIISRIGGEEFAILLPQTSLKGACEVAEHIRTTIVKSPLILQQGMPLKYTVSIGVSTLVSKYATLEMLLNEADSNLYEAKNSGRNKVCAPN